MLGSFVPIVVSRTSVHIIRVHINRSRLYYGWIFCVVSKFDILWIVFCFFAVDVATSVLLFVPILLMCVPSRETFPSYAERMGLKDRFGFDYPNGPPPPRGPRPGYGMAQPVANVYPSSLPMTKPYRNPYPSMPYSNRY